MTPEEMAPVLDAVAAGTLLARAAVAQLVAGGMDSVLAEEMVFVALGGGGVVETGEDGLERYISSGLLVRDVQAAMRR